MLLTEGIFRKPRQRTNAILKRFAPLFFGEVVNVSAANDSDKNCSLYEYYFGNYDSGNRYRDYFINATSYQITNYPSDETPVTVDDVSIELDLENDLDINLIERFDVVYNHTSLEHVFDVFMAFKNLCTLSKDIVILIVPQFQKIHDYSRGYKDYWRFTPFAIDRLFNLNKFTVLYRETTHGFSESQYLFYIASRHPNRWRDKFKEPEQVENYLNFKIDGSSFTMWSKLVLLWDKVIRIILSKNCSLFN